jgi:RNA polymerase sigma-70 factor, ECF subfamily
LFGLPASRSSEFEDVALPHAPDLYRMAVRVLGDPGKAEDVVQEAYLQAWKSFHRFESGTNCRAWLYRILFHTIQHHRRKWLDFRIIRESEEYLEQQLASPSAAGDRLTDADILRALDSLPEEFRKVILLADVEELAYREVASALNIPIGTVMSRLSRGRKLLRERLSGVAASYGIGLKAREAQA